MYSIKPYMLFSCPSNMKREMWLLAQSGAFSDERVEHEGYERKNQKEMN